MSLISDKYHNDKLKKYNINIKTKYIVGNKILERNTNNSVNDDIVNGVRCKKEYYLNNSLIHKENVTTYIEVTTLGVELTGEHYFHETMVEVNIEP